MTYIMGDSTNADSIPGGLNAYAGYDDGSWPDFPTINGQHPGVPILEITVFLDNPATGNTLDVENGDAIPANAPTYYDERTAAGVWRPVLYGSIATTMPEIVQFMGSRPRSSYRLWSAHYGAGKHICGPTTCGYATQVDGTQWIDHGSWDESLLSDTFFNVPIPTPAPTQPTGTPVPLTGEPGVMIVPFKCTTDSTGFTEVGIPLPPGTNTVVSASVQLMSVYKAGVQDSLAVAQPSVGSTSNNVVIFGRPNHYYTGFAECAQV